MKQCHDSLNFRLGLFLTPVKSQSFGFTLKTSAFSRVGTFYFTCSFAVILVFHTSKHEHTNACLLGGQAGIWLDYHPMEKLPTWSVASTLIVYFPLLPAVTSNMDVGSSVPL